MDDLLDGILSEVSQLRKENAKLKQDIEIQEAHISSLETHVTDLYPVCYRRSTFVPKMISSLLIV